MSDCVRQNSGKFFKGGAIKIYEVEGLRHGPHYIQAATAQEAVEIVMKKKLIYDWESPSARPSEWRDGVLEGIESWEYTYDYWGDDSRT